MARAHQNLGAEIGFLALLQTWARDLHYHPQVHCVVPAGGLSANRLRWIRPKDRDYFLPQAALPRASAPGYERSCNGSYPKPAPRFPPQCGASRGWPMCKQWARANRP